MFILKKQLMQTGATRYVDVDQAARDGRPQHQRQLGQVSQPWYCKLVQTTVDRHRCHKPARTGELIAGAIL